MSGGLEYFSLTGARYTFRPKLNALSKVIHFSKPTSSCKLKTLGSLLTFYSLSILASPIFGDILPNFCRFVVRCRPILPPPPIDFLPQKAVQKKVVIILQPPILVKSPHIFFNRHVPSSSILCEKLTCFVNFFFRQMTHTTDSSSFHDY